MTEEIITEIELRKKGQITIPSEVRNILNLKEGQTLILIVNNNEILLVPKMINPMLNIGILGKDKDSYNFREKLDYYKLGE